MIYRAVKKVVMDLLSSLAIGNGIVYSEIFNSRGKSDLKHWTTVLDGQFRFPCCQFWTVYPQTLVFYNLLQYVPSETQEQQWRPFDLCLGKFPGNVGTCLKVKSPYSEVPCSLRFFRFSFYSARNFPCNKQKIPSCSFINLLTKKAGRVEFFPNPARLFRSALLLGTLE